jgi:hypothetical protein
MLNRRYWIELDVAPDDWNLPVGLHHGCGVTAKDYDDAIEIVREEIFAGQPLPAVLNVIEDVDVGSLDGNEVLPNIGLPLVRGIWFPAKRR